MNINRNSFVIKESNKKPFKQEKFREQVRFLFNELNIEDIKQTDKFLKNLHNVDYEFLFDKKFTIQYKKRSSIRTFFSGELAYFNFKDKRDINSQIQKICIKTPSLYKTPIAKKGSILDNYIHESTHEKQYDRSQNNGDNDINDKTLHKASCRLDFLRSHMSRSLFLSVADRIAAILFQKCSPF